MNGWDWFIILLVIVFLAAAFMDDPYDPVA